MLDPTTHDDTIQSRFENIINNLSIAVAMSKLARANNHESSDYTLTKLIRQIEVIICDNK